EAFVFALGSASSAFSWGGNSSGELGLGNINQRNTPTPFTLANLASVALGVEDAEVCGDCGHSCAVLGDGTIDCWGKNDRGQLGMGSVTPDKSTPQPVPGIANVAQVALGYRFSCARLQTGAIRCWGRNDEGELGNGTRTEMHAPIP